MDDKSERILVLLLELVPTLSESIRRKRFFPGIYDTVLGVIGDYETDEQIEWSHLTEIVLQDQALLAAEERLREAADPVLAQRGGATQKEIMKEMSYVQSNLHRRGVRARASAPARR